jgi:hypothetical protein
MTTLAIYRHARCRGIPTLFRRLGNNLTGAPAEVIAIDGKTSRRFYQQKGKGPDPHGLSLRRPPTPRHGSGQGGGQIQRDRRPKLLDMMAIEGAAVTRVAS